MRWTTMLLAMSLACPAGAVERSAGRGEDVLAGLQAQVERNGTPRERALVAQFSKGGQGDPAARSRDGGRLRDAAASAPTDPLVQWLWSTTTLEATGCPGDVACADRVWAAARLDPDNAAAWGPVLDAALKARDAEAARSALDRMAHATPYAEPFAEAVGAWRELFRRHPMPASFHASASPYLTQRPVSRDELDAVAAVAFAAAMVSPATGLFDYCDAKAVPMAPAQDLARCLRVASLMQESPTVLHRMLGTALQRRAGGPEVAGFQRRQQWWSTASAGIDRDGREALRYFDDLVSTGSEIRAIELALRRAGKPPTPPADWVYVSPFAGVAAAADKAAAEAQEETGEAATAPARPARP